MLVRYVYKFFREYKGIYELVDSIVGTQWEAGRHCEWLNSTNERGHIYFERKEIYSITEN